MASHAERQGQLLAKARKARGMSQRAAARALGITQATLSRIEAGCFSITTDRLASMASIYKKSIRSLVVTP